MKRFLSQTLSIIHSLSLQMSDEPQKSCLAALNTNSVSGGSVYKSLLVIE